MFWIKSGTAVGAAEAERYSKMTPVFRIRRILARILIRIQGSVPKKNLRIRIPSLSITLK
jgi:hypothetical protein